MKTVITKQKDFDKIEEVKLGDEVIFEAEKIKVNCILKVFGKLTLRGEIDCSWGENRYIEAWGNSSPSIEARGNSSPSIEAWGNSSPSIVARGNSSPSIVARGNSSPSIEARENSSPSIVAQGNSIVRLLSKIANQILLYGFSILVAPIDFKLKIKKEATCIVQRYKLSPYLQREGIPIKNNKVILYKRVSSDFRTQENTQNETKWKIGSTVVHPAWQPDVTECGDGKFHACSKPYFCDEFRRKPGDKYLAIQACVGDLHEWPNPSYPHKIAFRKGKVLYECDKLGRNLNKGG